MIKSRHFPFKIKKAMNYFKYTEEHTRDACPLSVLRWDCMYLFKGHLEMSLDGSS